MQTYECYVYVYVCVYRLEKYITQARQSLDILPKNIQEKMKFYIYVMADAFAFLLS